MGGRKQQLMWWPSQLVAVVLLLAAAASHTQAVPPPRATTSSGGQQAQECVPPAAAAAAAAGGSIQVAESCLWGSALPSGPRLSVLGDRASQGQWSSGSATPTITAAAGADAAAAKQSTGVRLELQRLVLVGFQVAAPAAAGAAGTADQQPVLWPGGLAAGEGEALNMTDVRVVVSSQELFNQLLGFFKERNTQLWTDNTNFLHLQQWGDARTQLRSVGVLLQAAASAPPLQVSNCLLLATNTTLLPALLPQAAVSTAVPLLVYLSSNVTLGAHPPLPAATGLLIRRPVVFVGLQSLVTSINFEMVVNQLNLSSSPLANSTFVGLVLENLAPGDTVTSAVASPFSIAVTNNVWAVFYNRSTPQQVRWALSNVTLVVPQDSEMNYVTYMFTLYTSPLQYLKEQTRFYSDVLHMSMLTFAPGPGMHAITVSHLYSWFHRWGNVILTTQPQVAAPLPLPQRPLVLTTANRASPLVQPVRTTGELKAYAEQPVLGGREHILLFLSNVSLPVLAAAPPPGSSSSGSSTSSPIQLASAMLWVGYIQGSAEHSTVYALQDSAQQAAPAAPAAPAAAQGGGSRDQRVHLDCRYQTFAVDIPGAQNDGLQLQQLVLSRLPQGPGAAVPAQFRAVPSSLFTVLMWSFRRPDEGRALHLTGVTMMLPQPELDYFAAHASNTNVFVVEITGGLGQPPAQAATRGDALTFENTYLQGEDLRVGSITGPGLRVTNVTLRADPSAVAAMPGGYQWPDASQLRVPAASPAGQAPWVSAVIAVAVTLAVLLLALGMFMWWQRKRICVHDPEGVCVGEGSGLSKATSRSTSCGPGHTPGDSSSRQGSMGLDNPNGSSGCVTDVRTPVGAAAASSPAGVKQSPQARKYAAAGAAAAAAAAAAGASAGGSAGPLPGSSVLQLSSPPASEGRGTDVGYQRDVPGGAQYSSSGGADTMTTNNSLQDNVAAGMQRWRAAVSSTTMLLMERRMDAAAAGLPAAESSSGSAARSGATAAGVSLSPGDARAAQQEGAAGQPADAAAAAPAAAAAAAASPLDGPYMGPAGSGAGNGQQQQQLQLLEILGQGSFGSVFSALWRGKKIAVKVMQLPASALLEPGHQLPGSNQQQQQAGQPEGAGQEQQQQQRRRLQQQRNSPPHMAIMEAVVSSTMQHPNVVQVYNYTLSPLTSSGEGGQSSDNQAGGNSNGQDIAGWSLKLLMEMCDQGSLRDALDCGLLCKPGGFLAPSAVLSLAHDVAAAMLHLHSEGIVHGDLKAGNVMLTSSGSSSSSSAGGASGVRVWSASGDQRALTAKVADFGLALPLAPQDTHATLLARGTPTHMSPELFISGHVSKASDVYAYGILLFEIITGSRAYAGVPIPLLPHEVAMQGLRPEWPPGLPPGCRDLRKLAEACWAQKPQDRPSFADILSTLDIWSAGGHGWPAVPAGNRTLKPRQQQPQPQQPPDAQQQQQQQPGAPRRSAEQQPQQQGEQPTGQDQQQQGQPPPQQQQQAALQAQAGRTAGDAPGQRNMRMSWSEVHME